MKQPTQINPYSLTVDKENARRILGRIEDDVNKPYVLIPRTTIGDKSRYSALAIRFSEHGNVDVFMNANCDASRKDNYNGGDRYFVDPKYNFVQTPSPGNDSPWPNHIVISPLEDGLSDYNSFIGMHHAGKTYALTDDFREELHSRYEDRTRVLQHFLPEEILNAESQFLKTELGTDAFKALANTICSEFTNYTKEEPFTLTKTISIENGVDENGMPIMENITVPKDELDRLVITHSFMNDEKIKEKVAEAVSAYNDVYKEFRIQEIDYIAKINNNPLVIKQEEEQLSKTSNTFERDINLSEAEIQAYRDDVEKLKDKQNNFINSVILRRSDKIGEKIAEYEAIIASYENPNENDMNEKIFKLESPKMFEVKDCLLDINKEHPLNIHEMNDLMNEREAIANELRYKQLREEWLDHFPEMRRALEKDAIQEIAETQFANQNNPLATGPDMDAAKAYWDHLKALATTRVNRDDFVDRESYDQQVLAQKNALAEYEKKIYNQVDHYMSNYENCFDEFKKLKESGETILANGDVDIKKDPAALYSPEQYEKLSPEQKEEYTGIVNKMNYLNAVMNNHEDRFKIIDKENQITGEYNNLVETNIKEIGSKQMKISEAVETMADKYFSDETKAYLNSYSKTLELKETLENNSSIMQANLQQVSLRYTEILNLDQTHSNKELAEKTKETFDSLYQEYLINNAQLHVVDKHLQTQDYQKDYLTGPDKEAYSEAFLTKVKEIETLDKMGNQLFKANENGQNEFEETKLSYHKLHEKYTQNETEMGTLNNKIIVESKALEASLRANTSPTKEQSAEFLERKAAIDDMKYQSSQKEAQNHFIEQYVAKREILEKESVDEAIKQMDVSKLYVLDKTALETKIKEDYHEQALNQMSLPMQAAAIETVEYQRNLSNHDGHTICQIKEDRKLELVEMSRTAPEVSNILETCAKQEKLLNLDFEVLLNESLSNKINELSQIKESFEAKYEEKVTNVIVGNDIEKTIDNLTVLKDRSTNAEEIEKIDHNIAFCKKVDEINVMINDREFTIEDMLKIHVMKDQEKDMIAEYITNPEKFIEKHDELYAQVLKDYTVVKEKIQELQSSQDIDQIASIKQEISDYQESIKKSVSDIKAMEVVRESIDIQQEALHGFNYKEIVDKSNESLLLNTGEKLMEIRSQQREDIQTSFETVEKEIVTLQKDISAQKILKNETTLEYDVLRHKIAICESVCEEDENFKPNEQAFVKLIEKEIPVNKDHDDYDSIRLEHFNTKMKELMEQAGEKEKVLNTIDIDKLQATYDQKLSDHENLRFQLDCYDKINDNDKWNVLIEEKLQDETILKHIKDIESEIEKNPSLKTVKVATAVEREELIQKEEEFKAELESKIKHSDKEVSEKNEKEMSADEYAKKHTADMCK